MSAPEQPYVTLNNGLKMPAIGAWRVPRAARAAR